MIYLLSDEGRRALKAITGQALLYAFDFDGTLAPISADRDAVRMSPIVTEWLQELAKRAPCAVVSGRALRDVAPRINGAVPHLIGNHGIESPLAPAAELARAELICAKWNRELTTRMETLKELGAEIENKQYTLTVHFRHAKAPAEASEQILFLLSRLVPAPHLLHGKFSINALPPWQVGKGPAALALMAHLRLNGLFYIGDEETDETVFALAQGLTMGVRVGRPTDSRAGFFLHHQEEIEEVLHFLVHHLDRMPLTR